MAALRSILLAAALIAAPPVFAQSIQDQDAHHPDGAAGAQPQPTPRAGPQAGPAGRGMMGSGMLGPGMMGQGQAGPGGMMGRGMMSGMMGQDQTGSGMMPMMTMMMRGRSGAEHFEGRLAYIRAELKVTDAQTPQWNAFAEAARANAKAMSAMRDTMMSGRNTPDTLPDRLGAEETAAAAHLAAIRQTKEAVIKLYGVLDADQKKIADTIVVGPMGMPMGMM
jgi:hypothetical protein